MATKSKPNASEFIRSLPHTTPAKAVVEAGAKRGLKFSVNLVYAARNAAGKRKAGKGRPGRPAKVAHSGAEAGLRQAIAMLGLDRAREVMGEVEAAFRG